MDVYSVDQRTCDVIDADCTNRELSITSFLFPASRWSQDLTVGSAVHVEKSSMTRRRERIVIVGVL